MHHSYYCFLEYAASILVMSSGSKYTGSFTKTLSLFSVCISAPWLDFLFRKNLSIHQLQSPQRFHHHTSSLSQAPNQDQREELFCKRHTTTIISDSNPYSFCTVINTKKFHTDTIRDCRIREYRNGHRKVIDLCQQFANIPFGQSTLTIRR